jgi:hypothetical protein
MQNEVLPICEGDGGRGRLRLIMSTSICGHEGLRDMQVKSIPRIVWIMPAILLAIATLRLPYGYYTFTRIVICGVASLMAIVGFQERPAIEVCCALLGLIAVCLIHSCRSI